MFGFSFAELLVVLVVAIIFIKPQDLPKIAHFIGKTYYKAKSLFRQIKKQLQEFEKDFGVEDIRGELNRGIAEAKLEMAGDEDMTTIVDINGKEHKVQNISSVRSDLKDDELKAEIAKYNQKNLLKNKPKTKKKKLVSQSSTVAQRKPSSKKIIK